jgi:DNA polymerase-3 subunit gamma/tau
LRHLLVIKSGVGEEDLLGVTDVEVDRLKQLSSKFSEEDLVRLFHLLSETEKDIKDSPYPRFQLEIGLVKLAHATRLKTLDELIKRLEDLESRITGEANGGASNQETAKSQATKNNAPKCDLQPGQPASSEMDEPPDIPDFDECLYGSDAVQSPIQAFPREPATREAQTQSSDAAITPGREVEAILKEVQKMKLGLALTALEDAQSLEFSDGVLTATFGAEDMLAKRLREGGQIFREIGARLLGRPINLVVKISGQVDERIDAAESERRGLRERAMRNPAVRLIIEKTRAELLWVKEKDVL